MSNINRGIMTAKKTYQGRVVEYIVFDEAEKTRNPIVIPLWKAILMAFTVGCMSASYAYSVAPPETQIKEVRVPVIQKVIEHVPVPVCKALPFTGQNSHYRKTVNLLAAAIPARALAQK